MCFTTLTRDLACWVFTLANSSVREHYLVEVRVNMLHEKREDQKCKKMGCKNKIAIFSKYFSRSSTTT